MSTTLSTKAPAGSCEVCTSSTSPLAPISNDDAETATKVPAVRPSELMDAVMDGETHW